jgi:hypothetical protein
MSSARIGGGYMGKAHIPCVATFLLRSITLKINKNPNSRSLELQLQDAQAVIARQAIELTEALAELERLRTPSNGELRVVSAQPGLIDVREEMPTSGSRVLALTRGGTLIHTVWKNSERDFIGAWMDYPTVPKSVKKWLETAWIAKKF